MTTPLPSQTTQSSGPSGGSERALRKATTFVSLEVLRAYLAWWVVLSHGLHLLGAGPVPANEVWSISLLPDWLIYLATRGHWSVMVFMIVSGFVIANLRIAKHEAYPAYILRRAFRIVPIYLLCLALTLATQDLHRLAYIANPFSEYRIEEAAWALALDQNFAEHLALHLSLLHGMVPNEILDLADATLLSPAWSLSLEWQFYVVAPALVAVVMTARSRLRIAAVLMLAALHLSIAWQDTFTWSFSGFLPKSIGYFVLGILCRQLLDQHGNRKAMMLTCGLIFATATVLSPPVLLIWGVWYSMVLAEAGVLRRESLAGSLLRMLGIDRRLGVAGQWSYSTYLVHFVVYSIVVGGYVGAVGPARIDGDTLTWLVLACLPLILIVSFGLYHAIERPGIKLGNRVARLTSVGRGDRVDAQPDLSR